MVIGGALTVAVLAIGGAFAARWYFNTGAQPSEALPSSTLAYFSVDLEPNGKQKLAARELLEKFPAWDDVDADDVDDLREKAFDLVTESSDCEKVDFADDIEPWLGKRFAVALVDLKSGPEPVIVIQHTDADAAKKGFETLKECSGDSDFGGWNVGEDWLHFAPTEEIADEVAKAAEDDPLADNDEFNELIDAAGGTGLGNLYLSPDAGDGVLELLAEEEEFADLGPEATKAFADLIPGAAMTVKAVGGDLEITGAAEGEFGLLAGLIPRANAGDVEELVASLPDDTTLALGVSFEDNWAQNLADQMRSLVSTVGGPPAGREVDEMLAEAKKALGEPLPKTVEALFGDAAVIALNDEFAAAGADEFPFALKVRGDIKDIDRSLRAIDGLEVAPRGWLQTTGGNGDVVVLGPDPSYRKKVAGDGHLGETDDYRRVIDADDDVQAVFYINFESQFGEDFNEGFASEAGDQAAEVEENLEPLVAIGATEWFEDGYTRTRIRIAVD